MENICRGQCLFGQCPFPQCIKGSGARRRAASVNRPMEIETGFSLHDARCAFSGVGVAVDIGTTTVAAVAVDLSTGAILATDSAVNPQISFGPDVISRIEYCRNFGPSDPHTAIAAEINRLVGRITGGAPVARMSITGNTTMLCLLAGRDPSPMGVYPFTPPSLFGCEIPAAEAGLDVPCPVYLTPCMAPFVGGDITTAVLAASLTSGGTALLADIGTNGELALFDGSRLFATSTAAGPAFEGATIRCGMAAVPGAIQKVHVASDSTLQADVIGGGQPKGLCGSGLISAVNALLQTEKIEPSGLLCQESCPIAADVSLYRQDIREIQMAKAAICAGILALCASAGLEPDGLDRFCIAGGFGSHIDPAEAAGIGLFPSSLLPKTEIAGNAALGGCVMVLLDPEMQRRAETIAESACVLNLASDPVFMDAYIENMMF